MQAVLVGNAQNRRRDAAVADTGLAPQQRGELRPASGKQPASRRLLGAAQWWPGAQLQQTLKRLQPQTVVPAATEPKRQPEPAPKPVAGSSYSSSSGSGSGNSSSGSGSRAPSGAVGCRFGANSQQPGSLYERSYGLAMTQADRMAVLPAGYGPASYGGPMMPGGRPKSAATAGVFVCLVSSGVDAQVPALSRATLDGCRPEDPLDPGGCPFAWDRDADGQGTQLASIIAGAAPAPSQSAKEDLKLQLGVMPGAQIFSVRVWDRTPPGKSGGVAGDGPFANSRLLAHTACEGHLRGLAAQQMRRTRYRMVRGWGHGWDRIDRLLCTQGV